MAATTTARLGAATPVRDPNPDFLAYRLHLALHAQATMVDTLGDNYREFNAQDLWAVFSLRAEEAERLHDALLPD